MKIDNRLVLACAFLLPTASAELKASADDSAPTRTSFAYSISHTVKPLPESVIDQIADPSGGDSFDHEEFDFVLPRVAPAPLVVTPRRQPSRDLVCSAAASVALANNLPIPFFANLIWQESTFDSRVISRAGAQGIAQFMPRTAIEFGLVNPFEPIHALNVAGKFIRDLHRQFGNLGLAAAAYNAGPRRVTDWLAKRGELPGETRKYVVKITGRPAEDWIAPTNDPEMMLMPAKAPCVEVAEAVRAQEKVVRLARLMAQLADAAHQLRNEQDDAKALTAEAARPTDAGWRARATLMVRNMLKRIVEKRAATRIAANADRKASPKPAGTASRTADRDDDRSPAKPSRKPEAKAKRAAEKSRNKSAENEVRAGAKAMRQASAAAKGDAARSIAAAY